MAFWGVARTINQGETLAVSCLGIVGFATLFPKVRSGAHALPLFANYLFVELGASGEGWHQVDRTLGVLKTVTFGARPGCPIGRSRASRAEWATA
jgi:transcription antitermination factor NusG